MCKLVRPKPSPPQLWRQQLLAAVGSLWVVVGAAPDATPAQWRESSGATVHSAGRAVRYMHMYRQRFTSCLQSVRSPSSSAASLCSRAVSSDTETLVNFPEPEGTAWAAPADGHLDGYGGGKWGGGFQLAATRLATSPTTLSEENRLFLDDAAGAGRAFALKNDDFLLKTVIFSLEE